MSAVSSGSGRYRHGRSGTSVPTVAIVGLILIGVQMASAYTATCLMPPIANHINIALFPVYMLALLMLMTGMLERVTRVTRLSGL